MNKILLLLRAGLLAVALSMTAGAAHADVKAGVDAWASGDYHRAIRQWEPLAKSGDPDAQFNLAQAYKLGRGVPADLAMAEDLYGKAAAKGHVQAADAYGLLLFQRGERARALPYLEASASHGEPRARYLLGVAYFNGDLVPKDWTRAYALVSLAQQDGVAQATEAKSEMDLHIPLADRQKSVVLAHQLAERAEANRTRINASAELAPVAAQSGSSKVAHASATTGAAPALPTPRPTMAAARGNPSPKEVATRSSNATPRPVPPPKNRSTPPPANAGGPWRIQLGAFGIAANADALWAKVRRRPELSGHARALVPAGKLIKLQATGFASRADASAACTRLAAAGLGCLPVRD